MRRTSSTDSGTATDLKSFPGFRIIELPENDYQCAPHSNVARLGVPGDRLAVFLIRSLALCESFGGVRHSSCSRS